MNVGMVPFMKHSISFSFKIVNRISIDIISMKEKKKEIITSWRVYSTLVSKHQTRNLITTIQVSVVPDRRELLIIIDNQNNNGRVTSQLSHRLSAGASRQGAITVTYVNVTSIKASSRYCSFRFYPCGKWSFKILKQCTCSWHMYMLWYVCRGRNVFICCGLLGYSFLVRYHYVCLFLYRIKLIHLIKKYVQEKNWINKHIISK